MPTRPAGWPNVSATDVARPIEARLRADLSAHLEVASEGLPRPLEAPREWYRLPAFAAVSTGQVPAVGIIVDGLTGPPTWNRDSGYTASWDVTVAVWLRGPGHDETRTRCELYVAALRACLLSSPGGLSRAWVWADEHYDTVTEASAARTLAGGYLALTVEVAGAVVPSAIVDALDPLGEYTSAHATATPVPPLASTRSPGARGYLGDLSPGPPFVTADPLTIPHP